MMVKVQGQLQLTVRAMGNHLRTRKRLRTLLPPARALTQILSFSSLFVNIVCPSTFKFGGNLPVKVYIHGG
jgi:hypothetical protein